MMRISNEDLGVVNCANPSWLADDKKSWVFELQDCQVTSAPDLWPPLQMLAMLTMYNVKCTICKKSWVGWWRKTVGNANACYAHKVSLQSPISAEAGRDLGADRWQTFIVQQTVCILFTHSPTPVVCISGTFTAVCTGKGQDGCINCWQQREWKENELQPFINCPSFRLTSTVCHCFTLRCVEIQFEGVKCTPGTMGRVEHPNQLGPNWKAREGSDRVISVTGKLTSWCSLNPVEPNVPNQGGAASFTWSYPAHSSVTRFAIYVKWWSMQRVYIIMCVYNTSIMYTRCI